MSSDISNSDTNSDIIDDIILETSDINEIIPNILITEQIYTDEGRLKLNDNQIKIEVANLMPPNMPIFKLRHKTDTYFELFTRALDPIPCPKTLLPIIDINKYMLEDDFKPVFNYKIDRELDEPNHIKGQLFIEFIQSFNLNNRDKEDSYINTCRNLYTLFKPFEDNDITPINYETDALWQDTTFRLIPPISVDVGNRPDVIDENYLKEGHCPQGCRYLERSEFELLYKGDCPTIIGYANMINKDPYIEFNVTKYIEHLKDLEQDTKVYVYFNIPVYDYYHHEIISVEGRIISNSDNTLKIALDKNIQIENLTLKELECPINKYVPYFVYTKKFNPKFHKGLLKNTNVKIFYDKKYHEKYIKPQTWAEYLYSTGNNISFQNSDILMYPYYKNSLTIPIKEANLHLYKAVHTYTGTSKFFNFTKYANYLQYYHPYDVSTIDTELTRFQYLNNQPDYGLLYILQHEYKSVLNPDQIDKILNTLKEESNLIQRSTLLEETPGQLAKRYLTPEDMINDNNKTIYVDPEFDKTPYNLKKKYTTKQQLLQEVNEFESNCILAGKRPVKEGDYCIVGPKKKTFKWAKVSGEFMWIKTSGIHETCEKSLPSYDDLLKPNTMVLDSFDSLCMKISHAKNNKIYLELARAINLLEDMKIINNTKSLQEFLVVYLEICKNPKMSKPRAMLGYIDKYSDDYYDYTLENMFMNFEYDAGPTIINYQEKPKKPELTLLDMLCLVLEINDLTYDEQLYINTYVDEEYSEFELLEDIKKKTTIEVANYKNALVRIESQQKQNKSDFLKKIQGLHNKKLDDIKSTCWKQYYHKKILLCAGILSLVIMIRYPNIIIKKLVPGCIKYFSYKGAPVLEDENAQRSLTRYLACVLKSLYQPNDLKFGLFENMDNNYKSLLEVVNNIIQQKYDVREKLKEVQISENFEDIQETKLSYDVLNIFYRPCFDFVKSHYTNPVIEYLRLIHTKISSSQITKFNLGNIAFLRNACCAELLAHYDNFHDYFESEEIKKLRVQLNKHKKLLIDKNIIFVAQKKFTYEKLFKINVNTNHTPISVKEKVISKPEIHDEQWWENIQLNNILTFDFLKNRLKSANINYIERFVIQINELNNITSLRNIYANYLRGAFLTLVSKLTSLYTFKKKEKIDEASKFVRLLKSLHELKIKDTLLTIGSELKVFNQEIKYDSSSQDIPNASYNIMWFTNILLTFFKKALWIGLDKQYQEDTDQLSIALNSTKNKVVIGKIFEILDLVLDDMTDYLKLNYFDITELKKEVELLREKHKQEIMSKYSVDREERNQQKILKNMGLDILNEDVFDEQVETKEVVIPAEKEYDDNEIIDKGENPDEDIDHNGFD
jgi:hypothetical protein